MDYLNALKSIDPEGLLKDKTVIEYKFLYFDLSSPLCISSYSISKIERWDNESKIAKITFSKSKKQVFYAFPSAMKKGHSNMSFLLYLI
jgi:hypothetical protein